RDGSCPGQCLLAADTDSVVNLWFIHCRSRFGVRIDRPPFFKRLNVLVGFLFLGEEIDVVLQIFAVIVQNADLGIVESGDLFQIRQGRRGFVRFVAAISGGRVFLQVL